MAIRVRLSALIAASALVLVGCGSDDSSDEGVADLSASKILAKAEKQLNAEEFITIKGSGSDGEAGSEVQIDVEFAGETGSGSVEFSGIKLELLRVDGKSYLKAGKEFFASSGAPADVLDAIDGKWVLIDANNANFGEIANFVSKKEFVDEMLDPDGKPTKGEEKKVNGVDCIALKDDEGTLYVDKSDGKPIQLISTEDGEGTLNFSYDKVDEAEAPSADEVVDLAQLGA